MAIDRRPDLPNRAHASDERARARLESLGQVSAELLHDLVDGLEVIESRARLAASAARAGRMAPGEMDRVAERGAELSAMVRDVLEALRGAAVSPEVTIDVRECVERALVCHVTRSRSLELRLVSALPAGTRVRGRASFLHRAVSGLLEVAARQARSEVRVTLALDEPRPMDEEAAAVVCVQVEDDGAGLDPARAATLFAAAADDEPHAAPSLGAVAWTVSQLGGWVRHRPAETLGGACFEVRLPLAGPLVD